MKSIFILMSLLTFSNVLAENTSTNQLDGESQNWWTQRQAGDNIFYPHKIHMPVMEESGDACMLCHPFSPNHVREENRLKQLRQINNEPLKAICHECHLQQEQAPEECSICHLQASDIWPQDHNYNYKSSHGNSAEHNQPDCRKCHRSLSFCTDCHFKRDGGLSNNHPPAYKNMHGLDARIDPANCGSCHQAAYCRDCHQGGRR